MRTKKSLRRAGIIFSILTLAVMVTPPAPARQKRAKMKRPTVAIIRADWCKACQKLEPTMMELMNQYKDRINFVKLDVTDDRKAAEAAVTARKLGIGKFFEDNKKKTSTVVVLGARHQILYQTVENFDRDAYVKAFDEAIAKTARRS